MSDGPNQRGGAATLPGSGASSVQIPRAMEFIVTVRDNAGAVLGGADIRVEEDGATRSVGQTDDTGLLRVQARARATLKVHASLRDVTATFDVDVTAPGRFITLFLCFRYGLVRRYPWQSPFLRERVFWDEPQARPDAGAAAAGGSTNKPPPAERTRARELKKILEQFDPNYRPLVRAQESAREAVTSASRGTQAERLAARARLDAATAARRAYEDEHFPLRAPPPRDGAAAAGAGGPPPPDTAPGTTDDGTTAAAPQPQPAAPSAANIHRSLLTHLVRNVFPRLSEAELPLWMRYGYLHFSGLRYVSNHGQYARLSRVLLGLREPEILELEHPARGVVTATNNLSRQQLFREEYLALLDLPEGDPSITAIQEAASDLEDAAEEAFNTAHARDAQPRPSYDRRPTTLTGLRNSLISVENAGIVPLTRALSHVALVFSYARARACPIEECYGAIVDRRRARHMRDDVFMWIVRKTPLRNDFASPTLWGRPELQPKFARLAAAAVTQDWRGHHRTSLEPFSVGVVCNELVEMANAARGVAMRGGIQADSTAAFDDPHHTPTEAERAIHVQNADGTSQIAAVDAIANSANLAGTSSSGHRLFRVRSHDDLRVGDIYFVLGWAKFPVKDASAIVSPTTSMELRLAPPPTIDAAGHKHEASATLVEPPQVGNDAVWTGNGPPPAHAGVEGLIARSPRYFVGRQAIGTKFNYYLAWVHIGIYAGRIDGARAFTLETDGPAGLGTKSLFSWKFVIGRAHTPATGAPDLTPFLDPAVLLGGLDAQVTPI